MKVLIATGEFGEDLEVYYAVHRLREDGIEPVVAAPSKKRLQLVGLTNVTLTGVDSAAVREQGLTSLLQRRRAPPANGDVHSFANKLEGNGETDPFAGAGNDGALTIEF